MVAIRAHGVRSWFGDLDEQRDPELRGGPFGDAVCK